MIYVSGNITKMLVFVLYYDKAFLGQLGSDRPKNLNHYQLQTETFLRPLFEHAVVFLFPS